MASAPLTRQSIRVFALVSCLGFLLAGCASFQNDESNYPEQYGGSGRDDPFGRDAAAQYDEGGLFGPNGIQLFGRGGGSSGPAGIGVNAPRWTRSPSCR